MNEGKLNTVRELVEHLTDLGLDRALIADVDGSDTYAIHKADFYLWDEQDAESPVALDVTNFWEMDLEEIDRERKEIDHGTI